MDPVPIEPEPGHRSAPTDHFPEVMRAWWMDDPWSRGLQEWNRAVWDGTPIAMLVPLDLREVTRAFLSVGQGLIEDPWLAEERCAAWVSGFTAIGWAGIRRWWLGETEEVFAPDPKDRRFRSPEWSFNLYFWGIKEGYLCASLWLLTTLEKLGDGPPGGGSIGARPARERQATRFYLREWVNAVCPANFLPTNPEALRATFSSGGINLVNGCYHLLADLRGSQITVANRSQYAIGQDLAITAGQVVARNALCELIQYAPATGEGYGVPILIVPPWINKYYVMDLRPGQSLVEYLVGQGYTVFLLSWRNPDRSLAHYTLEDYLRLGPLEALAAVRAITGAPRVHLAGYCIGGTLLAITLAYLEARGQDAAASATLLTSLQDFEEVGETALFVSEEQLRDIEGRMEEKGYLDAGELSSIFRLMRSNDLIWHFFVERYLLGRAPPASELLYWSVDGTRLPQAMHAYYLRKLYIENKLVQPGALSMMGQGIDLGRVRCPCYVVAALDDHIVPWRSAQKLQSLVSGPSRFILAQSGHITGIINPPAAGRGGYFTNEGALARDWLQTAERHPGSWWPDWVLWLAACSGEKRAPPPLGSAEYPPLGPAPGRYVMEH